MLETLLERLARLNRSTGRWQPSIWMTYSAAGTGGDPSPASPTHAEPSVHDLDGIGQIETDEVYVGVDKQGAHYVSPVQAKAGRRCIWPESPCACYSEGGGTVTIIGWGRA